MASMFRRSDGDSRPDVRSEGSTSKGPAQEPAPPWEQGVGPLDPTPDGVRRALLDRLRDLDRAGRTEADRIFLRSLAGTLECDHLDLAHFPDTPLALDELLQEDELELRELLQVIERDPELVRRVWAQASSAGFTEPPQGLEQAITRVGLDQIWRLGVQQALQSVLFEAPGYQPRLESIRLSGLVGADLAASQAEEGRGPHYLAGLLRDVGALLTYRHAVGTARRRRPSPAFVEQVVRELHASIGLLVAHTWRLGTPVALGIAYHHAPSEAPEPHRRLAATLRLADVATSTALGLPGAGWRDAARLLRREGLSGDPARVLQWARARIARTHPELVAA